MQQMKSTFRSWFISVCLFVLQKRFELAPNFVFPQVRSIIISIFKLNNFNKNCFQCFFGLVLIAVTSLLIFFSLGRFFGYIYYIFSSILWSWFFSIYSGVIENCAEKKENTCNVVKEFWNVFQIFVKNCFCPCNDVPADLTLNLLINVQFLASLCILLAVFTSFTFFCTPNSRFYFLFFANFVPLCCQIFEK